MFDATASVLTPYGWKPASALTTRDKIATITNNIRSWQPVLDIKVLPYTDMHYCSFESGSIIVDSDTLKLCKDSDNLIQVGEVYAKEALPDTETLIQVSKLFGLVCYANIRKRRRVSETCIKATGSTPASLRVLLQLEAYSHENLPNGDEKYWLQGVSVSHSVKTWMMDKGIHIPANVYATLLEDIYEEKDGIIVPHPTCQTLIQWLHALALIPYRLGRTPNKGYRFLKADAFQPATSKILNESSIMADIDVDGESIIIKPYHSNSPFRCPNVV